MFKGSVLAAFLQGFHYTYLMAAVLYFVGAVLLAHGKIRHVALIK